MMQLDYFDLQNILLVYYYPLAQGFSTGFVPGTTILTRK